MSSVVFFGRAHAGKSTLVGSMIAKEKGFSSENLQRLQQKNLQEIPNYDPSSLYSSIVDDTKVERNRRGEGAMGGRAPGSTQIRHYRIATLPNGTKITLIDTPGAEHLQRERDRGMFAGDVGVFCIETADVINDKFLSNERQYRALLRTLSLWAGLSRTRVVVALTKMDEVGFSEEAFEEAAATLRVLTGELTLSLEFVPTAVDVRAMETFNLFESSSNLPWYEGPTLSESIQQQIGRSDQERGGEYRLLFSIDQSFKKPQSNAGQTWQIKVLSGRVAVDDPVVIAPVKNNRGEYFAVRADVKALHENLHRSEATVELATATSGQLVGLDLRSITTMDRRGISKDSIDTVYSSCGFSGHDNFRMGTGFSFKVPRSERETFVPGRAFLLVWLGRTIQFYVSTVSDLPDGPMVLGERLSKPIAMAMKPNGSFIMSTILILNQASSASNFIRGELLDVFEDNAMRLR